MNKDSWFGKIVRFKKFSEIPEGLMNPWDEGRYKQLFEGHVGIVMSVQDNRKLGRYCVGDDRLTLKGKLLLDEEEDAMRFYSDRNFETRPDMVEIVREDFSWM